MLTKFQMIIVGILVFVFISAGWYVKSLNDQVVKCKANTKIQKELFKKRIEGYDEAILEITKFYDVRIDEVTNFERGEDETDCDASKRFLNSFNY